MQIRQLIAAVGLLCVITSSAMAHGPQIQITNDNNKIVTRTLLLDSPYEAVTAPKSVYVIPIQTIQGISYAQPNNAIDPITTLPTFISGPGLAYGSDIADGGPQAFEADSVLSAQFTAGLKLWNGATFADPSVAQLKGFRGSNAAISTPPENFSITTDVGPFDSLSLAAVAANYGTAGAEVHSSFRWALLGDGVSPTSASPDGVYLVSLQIRSTQVGLSPSNEYYFVLHKNAAPAAVSAAVSSLGIAPALVQVVPEPVSAVFLATAAVCLSISFRPRRRQ